MKLSLSRETLRTLTMRTGVRAGGITIPVATNPYPDPTTSGPPGSGNSAYLRQCGNQVGNHAELVKQAQVGNNDSLP